MKSISDVFEEVEKEKVEEGKFGRGVKKGVRGTGRFLGRGLRSVGSFLKDTYTSRSHMD